MEQKLSNEERARIFALYIGCDTIDVNDEEANLVGVTAETVHLIHNSTGSYGTSYFSGIKLLLTPLSEISDEHAIEIVKIVAGLYIKESLEDVPVKVAGRDGDGVKVMAGYVSYKIFTTGDIIGAHEDIDEYVPVLNISQAIDFLRFKNYALPYKNLDLFEAGIAIKKETK